MGDPSPTLERAAVMERGFVVKDFGRLGKVVVVRRRSASSRRTTSTDLWWTWVNNHERTLPLAES